MRITPIAGARVLLRKNDRLHLMGYRAEHLDVLGEVGSFAAAEAAFQAAGEAGNTPQTRYYLWKATGRHEHLTEAKRLLDYRIEHAPAEYHGSRLKNVRLNREIMEAWAEHGEKAMGEGDGAAD